MAGKFKSGFGFKSGFSRFSQIRWIWIGFVHFYESDLDLHLLFLNFCLPRVSKVGLDLSFFKRLDLDLKIGLDLNLNIAGFAHHCYEVRDGVKTG